MDSSIQIVKFLGGPMDGSEMEMPKEENGIKFSRVALLMRGVRISEKGDDFIYRRMESDHLTFAYSK
jgi:hypothetical protein